MYIQEAPAIILPKKRPLLKRVLRGNEYYHDKEREHNKYLGMRAWQLKIYNWAGQKIKVITLYNESDVIDLFTAFHTPGYDPREYNIPPEEIGYVQLCIIQAITSTGSGTFSVPDTWGPNTCSVIGGGGNGASALNNNLGGSPSRWNLMAGGGGGGGALSQATVNGLTRNGLANYFCAPNNAFCWFKDTSTLLAFGGLNASSPGGSTSIGGQGGQASSGIGSFKTSGGNGGNGSFINTNSTSSNFNFGGGGGGGAGGTFTDGSDGVTGPGNINANTNGGTGGQSDTATFVTGTNGNGGNGNPGTDFDASHGAGSGAAGGGTQNGSNTNAGGVGGLYGGGGGGGASQGRITPGNGAGNIGAQGMIWLSWFPYAYSEIYQTN